MAAVLGRRGAVGASEDTHDSATAPRSARVRRGSGRRGLAEAPRAQVAPPAGARRPPRRRPPRSPATLPLDPAIRAGRLPNGLRYFVRQNGRPANRVSLRLAVDAGSVQEADDQRGLAHFLEHMAFNGSTHFKPGELVAFLESIGARFGPHVNASTSFDETIYMLDVPTDREGYVDKALLALRDFAGGASLTTEEIDRERGVVLEEWRGRLGASSRITDQQLPVIFYGSRYADRLPIGLPETLKAFPPDRVRDFYRTWYRADRMAVVVSGDIAVDEAERLVRGTLRRPADAGRRRAPAVNATVPVQRRDPGQDGRRSRGAGLERDRRLQARGPRPRTRSTPIGDRWSASLGLQMLNARLAEVARDPKAPFLAASADVSSIGRNLSLFELSADVAGRRHRRRPRSRGPRGAAGAAVRVRGAGARSRPAGAAGRLRARLQRAQHRREPAARQRAGAALPGRRAGAGHRLRVRAGQALRARRSPPTRSRRTCASSSATTTASRSAWLRRRRRRRAPTDDTLKTALAAAFAAPVTAWTDALAGRALVANPPAPGTVTGRRQMPAVGVTVLTLSNGVEVWLKPTDFKADQVVFTGYAYGGRLAGQRGRLSRGGAAAGAGRDGRAGRTDAGRPREGARRPHRLGLDRHGQLHARAVRVVHAQGPRDRAAAGLPHLHRAGADRRRLRPAEAALRRDAGQPAAEPALRVQREGARGHDLGPLHRRAA